MSDARLKSGARLGAFVGAVLLIPAGLPLWMTVLLHSDRGRSFASLLATALLAFALLLGTGALLGAVVGRGLASRSKPLRLPKSGFGSFLMLLVLSITLAGLELGFLVSPISLIGLGSTATSVDMWALPFCVAALAFSLGLLLAVLAIAGRFVVRGVASQLKTPSSNR
jgi:hypothetical protein